MSAELTQLLTALPGIIVHVDSAGAVQYVSPAAMPLSLVRDDRLRSSRLRKFVDDVRSSGHSSTRAWDMKRGDERDEFVVHGAPFEDGSILLTFDDVSEARRLDAVRRDFVSNVSHELKTPVSALSLLAEAVAEAADEPDAVKHFTKRMKLEAQRLATLVGDLLDLSLLSHEGLRAIDPIEVDSFVLTATDAVSQIAQNREVSIEVAGETGLLIYGDREQLVMALRNLLTNAVGHSPTGATVKVLVRRLDETIEISVSDEGDGIPEDVQPRIFERFFRVDPGRSRETGGTGLGLAIVKHVCANHGGDCTVTSVLDEGATFTLRLPTYIDPAAMFDVPDDDDEQQNPATVPQSTQEDRA
jgi:two-component system, OmpR family, sensor histidine kinase SenX3